jgi:hypothetical protein
MRLIIALRFCLYSSAGYFLNLIRIWRYDKPVSLHSYNQCYGIHAFSLRESGTSPNWQDILFLRRAFFLSLDIFVHVTDFQEGVYKQGNRFA